MTVGLVRHGLDIVVGRSATTIYALKASQKWLISFLNCVDASIWVLVSECSVFWSPQCQAGHLQVGQRLHSMNELAVKLIAVASRYECVCIQLLWWFGFMWSAAI